MYRYNQYWDWTDFSIGFTIAKPNPCTGYKLYIGFDIAFWSIWVYLNKIRDGN